MKNGERTEGRRRGVTTNVYQHTTDGVRYTVVTEKNDRGQRYLLIIIQIEAVMPAR